MKPIVDLIQPALRVLIELGYNRTIPYGQPTPAGLFPAINPVTLAANFVAAVGQGIQAALADLGVRNTSPPAPSTTANPSTLSNVPTGDSPAATTQTTQPRSQSQSTTSTSLGAPTVTAPLTPKTGPDPTAANNTRGASAAAANKNSAAATINSSAEQPNGTTSTGLSLTSAAAKTIPSGSAASTPTKPEKPIVSTPMASWLPRVTLPAPSGIGTPNWPSIKTAVPTGVAGTNATHATSTK